MVDLYVYYKVRSEDAARLAPLVQALQGRLARDHGVGVQLKRRPEPRDGLQTWMEVYPGVAAGFETILADAVDSTGVDLARLLAGPRHTEVFTDVPPCA